MSLSAKRPSKNLKDKLLQEVQDIDKPKKRLNAEVEANLYKQIKTRAVMEERSISDITRQLWIDYLATDYE